MIEAKLSPHPPKPLPTTLYHSSLSIGRGGNDDLSEVLEVLDSIDAEGDGITDVEGLDNALEELGEELIKGWLGDLKGVAAHEEDSREFDLAVKELV